METESARDAPSASPTVTSAEAMETGGAASAEAWNGPDGGGVAREASRPDCLTSPSKSIKKD